MSGCIYLICENPTFFRCQSPPISFVAFRIRNLQVRLSVFSISNLLFLVHLSPATRDLQLFNTNVCSLSSLSVKSARSSLPLIVITKQPNPRIRTRICSYYGSCAEGKGWSTNTGQRGDRTKMGETCSRTKHW